MITNNYINALFGQCTDAPLKLISYSGAIRYTMYYAVLQQMKNLSFWFCFDNVFNNANLGNAGYHVVFGSGNNPATPNDYTMDFITGLTATVVKSVDNDDNGASSTAVFTITNTNSNEVTISEVGIFSSLYTRLTPDAVGASGSVPFLMERTVLDTPVTIPAGGVGQVTYTIRRNYPTA